MPFHNGLRDVSMGSGPIRLAHDDQFRAGIEAEGWTVADDEVHAVDEHDPETGRAAARDLEPYQRARVNQSQLKTVPCLQRLLDCIRRTGEGSTIAAAGITAYDPAYDSTGPTIEAARAVARQIARAASPQTARATG